MLNVVHITYILHIQGKWAKQFLQNIKFTIAIAYECVFEKVLFDIFIDCCQGF